MTPEEQYNLDVQEKGFTDDPEQRHAVTHLQALYTQLINKQDKSGLFNKLLGKQPSPKGLYLLGGTGRGKTHLVDCFYAAIPFKEKHRTHFHQFMRDIHARLKSLNNIKDPLKTVARDLSKDMRLLCLDEFNVQDIGDAMIMSALIKSLNKHGIILVITSNIAINDLYQNGLQRERFLPTIELLHNATLEVDMGDGTDYRMQLIEANNTYFISQASDTRKLEVYMQQISPCAPKHNRSISVNDRDIKYIAYADDVIWFDFNELCNTPRSDNDYLYMADIFHTIIISDIYLMHEEHDNIAKRFIHLIDALYDHKVKCIFSAHDKPENLYRGRLLEHPFRRTSSRLVEMSSKDYLSKAHLISPEIPAQ